MSLRAVGEGHISSIEFRTGLIDAASNLSFDPLGPRLVTGSRTPPAHYDKAEFAPKLTELGAGNDLAWSVLNRLPERFTLAELERSLETLEREGPPHVISYETAKIMRVLAASSYVASFPADSSLSERIIFPAGPHETNGMEDARFVRFTDDDGSVMYYATYTAYDGHEIVPQLIETDDFLTFRIATLNGNAAQNKGMALFPRRIGGQYVMLSRQDRENLHLIISADVRTAGTTCPTCIGRSRALGVGADRQLRLAHRDGGRLAGHHPRRRSHAAVLIGALAARPRRSPSRDRPPARTAARTRGQRARRLRAQRRLLLRRDGQRQRPGAPLRAVRCRRRASRSFPSTVSPRSYGVHRLLDVPDTTAPRPR